ncbi:MAG TPA: reverse transcriptase domain-containing protein [Terriglobia bacterium]|nr:reverse transcriptase domain-containing protein [Terriglobia bacterium]
MLPPLISFKNSTELKRALFTAGALSAPDDRLFDKLVDAGLPPLLSPTVMGLILGISPKLITAMAAHPRRGYPYYRRFEFQKKSGGKRVILAPRTFLKAVQIYVLHKILETQPVPKYVTGFVKGRGIIENATIHMGAKYLLNIDIKDFFPSVKTEDVVELFRKLGFPPAMSRTLGHLCTYQGGLPQGAPTSPCIANLVLRDVDETILRICKARHISYSRYADDLTFSSERPIDGRFLTQVAGILKKHDFSLNMKKIRFAKPGQSMYVTGLVVNKKVQPNRIMRRQLRAMFHQASKNPREFRHKWANLMGWASYVNSYDRELGQKYLAIVRDTVPRPTNRIVRPLRNTQ